MLCDPSTKFNKSNLLIKLNFLFLDYLSTKDEYFHNKEIKLIQKKKLIINIRAMHTTQFYLSLQKALAANQSLIFKKSNNKLKAL